VAQRAEGGYSPPWEGTGHVSGGEGIPLHGRGGGVSRRGGCQNSKEFMGPKLNNYKKQNGPQNSGLTLPALRAPLQWRGICADRNERKFPSIGGVAASADGEG